jgi:hypothetical protein
VSIALRSAAGALLKIDEFWLVSWKGVLVLFDSPTPSPYTSIQEIMNGKPGQ